MSPPYPTGLRLVAPRNAIFCLARERRNLHYGNVAHLNDKDPRSVIAIDSTYVVKIESDATQRRAANSGA